MSTHSPSDLRILREQLLIRRDRLERALQHQQTSNLVMLLHSVDQALEKMDVGEYGLCETCHDAIETDRLLADPLTSFCIDHLTPKQQRDLEDDMELAAKIQNGLLPQRFSAPGWQVSLEYRPASVISGDYCDLMWDENNQRLYFMLGDVAGKGIAAAMLMSNLHAMFRALISAGLPLHDLMTHASRVFCGSTLPTQYATLICGTVDSGGQLEMCNAGHVPAILVGKAGPKLLESTGVPVGLFCDAEFTCTKAELWPGDSLILYTDGISEAENVQGSDFGVDRLATIAATHAASEPCDLIKTIRTNLDQFRNGAPRHDDETLLALQFAGSTYQRPAFAS